MLHAKKQSKGANNIIINPPPPIAHPEAKKQVYRGLKWLIVIILLPFILLLTWGLWSQFFPNLEAKRILGVAIINSDYFFRDVEILKGTRVGMAGTYINAKVTPEIAKEMTKTNILRMCVDLDGQCIQRHWHRHTSYDTSGNIVHQSDYECIEAGIKGKFSRLLCVDTGTGKFHYSGHDY